MATGYSPAASAAAVRRRTHAIFIICKLFVATWPLASPAQNISSRLVQPRLGISKAADLAGRYAICVSPSSFCSTWRIR